MKLRKIFIVILLVAAIGIPIASIAKSDWQDILESKEIPENYWDRYLPNINSDEFEKTIEKYENDTGLDVELDDDEDFDAKYPLPATSGKIAIEQHLTLGNSQSASSHYKMSGTPASCRNGMAGGSGAFGPLKTTDKNDEKYYVTMRWLYADWVEPESKLSGGINKDQKSLVLKDASDFPKSGYLKIGAEYIHYSSKSKSKLKGLSRGHRSTKTAHKNDSKVQLVYRYKGGSWQRMTRSLDSDKKIKNWYRKKRVMLTNVRNGKKVVASILESGPAIWTGRVGGLSPEAFHAIGAKNNEKCTFRYVDTDKKLGPVK